MGQLIIRLANREDPPYLAAIDKECFSDPWSEESFRQEIEEHKLAVYLVAEVDGERAGYVGMWQIVDEGHITNVAVLPKYRGKHVASAILSVFFEIGKNAGLKAYTLEVRKSNEAAKALYKKFGFEESGVRPGYYPDNHEDAIIMWRR